MAFWVEFKGEKSTEFGFKVLSCEIPSRPKRSTENIALPGRAESLTKIKSEYTNISITVCFDVGSRTVLREAFEWLSGRGNLIVSDESGKFYKATSCDVISTTRVADSITRFTVKFDCAPFAYTVSNPPISVTENTVFTVGGSIYCEPIYKVYCNGNGSFSVNGQTVELTDIDEYITIDSSIRHAYKGQVVQNSKCNGIYPFLSVGENAIQITDNVTQIEIWKNERWL